MTPGPPPPSRVGPPLPVRAAGVSVLVQGLIAVGFAITLAVGAAEAALPPGAVIGESVLFVVIGAALAGVGIGLLAGRRWARTPAIVAQLLLLPVVYSLIGPSRQLLLGIVAGVYVVVTFLLLIGARSRTWSMDLDPPEDQVT